MDLEELEKQLYKEGGQPEGRVEKENPFAPGRQTEPAKESVSPQWQKEAEEKRPSFFPAVKRPTKNIKFFIIGIAIILLAVAGFIIWRRLTSFDNAKVSLNIFGPDRIASGEEVNYIIKYKNGTDSVLDGATLTFIYPSGSIPKDKNGLTKIGDTEATVLQIPSIGPGQENQVELQANVTGLQDEQKKAQASLKYQPAGFSSEFENKAEFGSDIFSVPLVLDFDLPERVVSGQELNFTLKYVNTSQVSFSNLTLQIEYPPGFNFVSASPEAAQGSNIWQINEISPQEQGQILISGSLSGVENEIKTFKAKIGMGEGELSQAISQYSASSLISASPLSITTSVNDNREYLGNVGDTLHYKLDYKNTTDVPINSVFINLKFANAKMLELSSFRSSNGFFNNVDSVVSWNESSVPELKTLQPGQAGSLEFYIKIKDTLPINNFNDKNFVITSTAKIDSVNIPVSLRGTQITGQDDLSIKINSKLILAAKGFFYDNDLPNSGPLPPTVGQQTTYTIYWYVMNLANDVDNVVVESYLPPYVRWIGNYEPGDANLKYDQNTGKITWTIGKLAANTGTLSSVKKVGFQIGLVPSSDQAGSVVELIKNSTIGGKDLFTGASLEGIAGSIKTNLPDDPMITDQQKVVRY